MVEYAMGFLAGAITAFILTHRYWSKRYNAHKRRLADRYFTDSPAGRR